MKDLYLAHVAALQRKYEPLFEIHHLDAIVLHSGVAQPRTRFDDQFWPLRPLPQLQHWLPLAAADSALVVRPGKRPHLLIKQEDNFWERPPAVPFADFEPLFEISNLRSIDAELPSGRVARGTKPDASEFSHRLVCWLTHQKHEPHVDVNAATTRSPALTLATSGPTSSTVPVPSWPRIVGGGIGTHPCMTERSE